MIPEPAPSQPFPASPPSQSASTAQSDNRPRLAPLQIRVLLIDDSPDDRQLMIELLAEARGARFDVVERGTLQDGLAFLAHEDVDVAILDLQLPDAQGIETVRRFRAAIPELPLVVVTAIDDHAIGIRAVQEGAQDQLVKFDLGRGLLSRALLHAIERQRLLQQINTLNRELEARVQERTGELEQFAYSISHDLRQPLRALTGFSRALAEDYDASLPPEGHDYVRRIGDAAGRMEQMVDGVLTLSRLTQRDLDWTEVDLSALAHEAIADLRAASPHRDVEVTIANDVIAPGDKRLLRLVLQNLLGNAWKFTATTPRARICFEERSGAGERVYCVADNGVGFDMAYARRLFGLFQRLHSTDDFEGLGIGLATVNRIITRHGGKIWADSRPGEGARFCFTLGSPDSPR